MSSVTDKPARRRARRRPTLADLQDEIGALRQRVEDLEDLRELNQAIERNGAKPLVPWTSARKELGLD